MTSDKATPPGKGDDFDLDDLKSAMTRATPAPAAATRAAHLALAAGNFEKLHAARQGSAAAPRPTSERRERGVFSGVRNMLNALSTKGGLTVTTAIVACGFIVLTPQGQDLLTRVPGLGADVNELSPTPIGTESGTDEGVAATPVAEAGDDEAIIAAPAPEAVGEAAPVETVAPTSEMARDVAEAEESAPDPMIQVEEMDMAADMAADMAPEAEVMMQAEPEALMAPAAPVATNRMMTPGDVAPAPTGGIAPAEMITGALDVAVVPTAPDTEAFANEEPNAVSITAEEPVSTFSIDVDTAAYSLVRQSLNAGVLPPRDAVRVEEMINYFPYDYAAPEPDAVAPFAPTITVMDTPWNRGTELVHIGLQGVMPVVEDRPPLNLVFLIDTSGSMSDANKLPLLRQSFLLMLDELRPEDEVAIVEYAGSAGIALEPSPASNRAAIAMALMRLGAGGSTNGQGGLEQAYATAAEMADEGDVSRVILATDGDFNVGLSGIDELEEFISSQRDTGTYLSVLGFGRGNLDDATMQALAQNGNGVAAYIDTLNEAQKVLVDQLTGALFAIAGDVKVQVEFNPAYVAEYRLIGYETRALEREDFNNDAVDAGELGAGHSVTAIYEITPVGSDAVLNDPLRYAPAAADDSADDGAGDILPEEIGFLRLRWKAPGEDDSQLMETPIMVGTTPTPGTEAQFATAVAGFGQLLRGGDYLGDWGWDEAIALANAGRGEDLFGYRTEAVQLMRLAESLSRN